MSKSLWHWLLPRSRGCRGRHLDVGCGGSGLPLLTWRSPARPASRWQGGHSFWKHLRSFFVASSRLSVGGFPAGGDTKQRTLLKPAAAFGDSLLRALGREGRQRTHCSLWVRDVHTHSGTANPQSSARVNGLKSLQFFLLFKN